jgi:hypothetical protein
MIVQGVDVLANLPPSDTDLGLDRRLPWNTKFHIKPEAFNADGFIPEAPSRWVRGGEEWWAWWGPGEEKCFLWVCVIAFGCEGCGGFACLVHLPPA